MKYFSLMAIAIGSATAFAPLALLAQGQVTVTDAQATVPVVVYQSVFKELPTGVETQSLDWKKANGEVAQFPRGHVDILKWEEAQLKARSMEKGKDKAVPVPAGSHMAKPVLPAAAMPPAVHKH